MSTARGVGRFLNTLSLFKLYGESGVVLKGLDSALCAPVGLALAHSAELWDRSQVLALAVAFNHGGFNDGLDVVFLVVHEDLEGEVSWASLLPDLEASPRSATHLCSRSKCNCRGR